MTICFVSKTSIAVALTESSLAVSAKLKAPLQATDANSPTEWPIVAKACSSGMRPPYTYDGIVCSVRLIVVMAGTIYD